MKQKLSKAVFVRVLCLLLMATIGFTAAGCGAKKDKNDVTVENGQIIIGEGSEVVLNEKGQIVLGEGSAVFVFQMKDKEENVTEWEIHTDEKTVGGALMALGLIEGEEGEYGIYVKKVCGIEADYDKDQSYWAFYVDGEYGTSGVDQTEIETDKVYAFVYSK